MKIRIFTDKQALGQAAAARGAEYIRHAIRQRGRANIDGTTHAAAAGINGHAFFARAQQHLAAVALKFHFHFAQSARLASQADSFSDFLFAKRGLFRLCGLGKRAARSYAAFAAPALSAARRAEARQQRDKQITISLYAHISTIHISSFANACGHYSTFFCPCID